MPLDVGLIVEDRRFRDFLEPAIRALASNKHIEIGRLVHANTQGCRTGVLRNEYQRLSECDAIVVAADAFGQRHVRRGRSHRQKARTIRETLDPEDAKLIPAIAQPSVEAWLMSDPRAFARGLEEGTRQPFRMPAEWPNPRTEREAKSMLGNVVAAGLGSPLPRSGFEFAERIVATMDLEAAPNESLADWARGFCAHLRGLRRA